MIKKKIKKLISQFLVFRKTYIFKGDDVHCEICDFKSKSFFNLRCVKCNSLPRTRLIPFSIRFFGITKIDKLLHIAPNVQEYNYILKKVKFSQYDRLNIVPYEHVNIVDDITKSQIKDKTYSLIIIWHVLEHIPDDKKAISEMYRILEPNGNLLVSVPIYPKFNPTTFEDQNVKKSDYESVYGHPDHCRGCGLDYFKRFEEVGFSTTELHTCNLEQDIIKKFGLSNSHTVWLFKK